MKKRSIFISVLISMLVIIMLSWYSGEKFSGTDDMAEIAISEINESYEPWIKSIWEPSSAITENVLFGIQGAIGSAFIIYYIGKKKNVKNNRSILKDK